MRYISRFKNSIRASSVYGLAFMLTFALAAGLTTYEEAAAQPSVTLTVSPMEIDESNTSATVTVTAKASAGFLTAPNIVLTLSGTARMQHADSTTFAAGDDYRLAAGDFEASGDNEGKIVLELGTDTDRGDNSEGTKTLNFTVNNDGAFEVPKTIVVNGSLSGSIVRSATIMLIDDDYDITLAASIGDTEVDATLDDNPTVDEDVTTPVSVMVTATLSSTRTSPVTVALNYSGTAPSSYYTAAGTPSITIAAGSMSGSTNVTIDPNDNDTYGGNKSIIIGGRSGTLQVKPAIGFDIEDNEEAPSVTLTAAPKSIAEDAGATNVVLTAELVGALLESAATVKVAVVANDGDDTNDGTTAETDDYTIGGSTSITISPGSKTGTTTMVFTPNNDAYNEENAEGDVNETVVLQGSSEGLMVGTETITIVDDDFDIVLELDNSMVSEDADEAVELTLTARLTGGVRSTDLVVPVALSTDTPAPSGYTITINDATDTNDDNITIKAGDPTGTAKVTVTVLAAGDDEVYSGDMKVNLVANHGTLTDKPISITLVEDEAKPTITLSADPTTLTEGGTDESTITATLSGAHAGTVTVTLSFGGTATKGADKDYIEPQNQTIEITGGLSASTSGAVDFQLFDDGAFENPETIIVSGTSSPALDVSSVTLTVNDDDYDVSLAVGAGTGTDFVAGAQTVNEGDADASSVTVRATLNSARTTPLTIALSFSGDGAMSQYAAIGGTTMITIAPGAADSFGEATVTIDPVNNELRGGDKTIMVSGSAAGVNVAAATESITIMDDEVAPTVSIKVEPARLNEDAGSASVVVTAEVNTTGAAAPLADAAVIELTIDPAEVADTGANPAVTMANKNDFTVSGTKSITIPAGGSSASTTLTVNVVDDPLFEQEETITVSAKTDAPIGDTDTDPTTPAIANATITIVDNDFDIKLSVDTSSIAEDASDPVKVKVTATQTGSRSSDIEIAVTYTLAGAGSALSNAISGGATITIDAGKMSGEAEVTITPSDAEIGNNTTYEGDRTINVAGVATGYNIQGTTITVADDEEKPTVTLTVAPTSITESGTPSDVTVTVELKPNGLTAETTITFELGGTAVNVPTMDGDGYADRDYSATPGSINLTGGDVTTTHTISIAHNDDDEFEEPKTIIVSGKSDDVASVSSATVMLLTDDYDVALAIGTMNGDIFEPGTVEVGEAVENPGAAVVQATLQSARTTPLTIALSFSGPGAASSYSTIGGTTSITVAPGQANATGRTTITIDPVNNILRGGNKDINVTGTAAGINIQRPMDKITIIDDEAAPTVTITPVPARLNEDAGAAPVVVTAKLSDGAPLESAATITLKADAADVSASNPDADPRQANKDDFSVSGSLEIMIPAGMEEASTTLTVNVVDDPLFERDEIITVTASTDAPVALAEGGATDGDTTDDVQISSKTITIVDNDFDVKLAVSPASVTEGGDDATASDPTTVTVTATLPGTRTSDVAITVAYNLGDSDQEWDGATGDDKATITIKAGDMSGSTEVSINTTSLHNATYEGDRTLNVVGSSDELNVQHTKITIADDEEKPTVELMAMPSNVTEGPSATSVTLNWTVKPNGLTAATTVTLETSGTALRNDTSGTEGYDTRDYSAPQLTSFTIPAGATADVDSDTFEITPRDDDEFEETKTIIISGKSDAVASVSSTTINLLNDDYDVLLSIPAQVGDPPADQSTVVPEDATDPVSIVIQAALEAPRTSPLTVQLTFSGTEASRYTVGGTTTITLGAGVMSSTATVNITPNDNDLRGGDKMIEVGGTATGVNVQSAMQMITLRDNEPEAALTLTAAPTSIDEGGPATDVALSAELNVGMEEAATIELTITDASTATGDGTDYTAGDIASIMIPRAGKSGSSSVTITPVDDNLHEDGDETIVVMGAGGGLSDTATITINDNDYDIRLSTDVKEVAEGDDATDVVVTATLFGGGRSNPVTVMLAIHDSSPTGRFSHNTGTAMDNTTPPPVYTITEGQGDGAVNTLTIAAGSATGTATISIDPNPDDNAFSGDQDIVIVGATSDNQNVGSTKILLRDAQRSMVTLSTDADEPIMEAGGMAVDVVVTATLSEPLPAETVVTLAKGGTATKGEDYDVTGEGTITVASGETEGTTTLTITPVDDLMAEGADGETIIISGSATANLRVHAADAIDLLDNNAVPLASVMVDVDTINEGDGATDVVITAILGGTSNVPLEIGLTKPGSATFGEDYVVTSEQDTFVIAAGDTMATKEVTITPDDDMVYEGDEVITVTTVSMLDDENAGDAVTTDIALVDNDAVPTVALSVDPMTIAEGEEVEFTITATASGMASMPIAIGLDKSGGTAVKGEDFDITAESEGAFMIAPLSLTADKMVTVMANADMLYENDEVINVGGTAGIGETDVELTSADITLTDGDMVPTVALSVDPMSISEDGGDQVVTVTATASGASSMDMEIELSKSGTAVLGEDFEVTGGEPEVFMIAANELTGTKMLTLTPMNDDIYEADEHIVVGGMIGERVVESATITLTDDEMMPMVALSTDVSEVTEHGGSQDVVVTATLSGLSSMDISVVLTKSGSAVKGEDYDVTAGESTITVAAGDISGSTTLSILGIDDHFYEGNEMIEIGGTAGEMMAEGTSLTLVDDESLPTVTLTAVPDMIDEGGGPQVGVVTATLSGLSALDLHVGLVPLLQQSTASLLPGPGNDISILELATTPNIVITVPAKMESGSINLTVVPTDDDLYETNEYAVFAGNLMGTISAPVTITIVDDDAPAIALSANPTTLREDGGSQSVTFDVEMSGIPVPLETVISLTKGGTATKGTDYTPSGNTDIVIAAGAMTGSTTLGFAVVDDDVYEPSNETIVVSANWDSQELDNVTLTIIDNFPAPAVTSAIPDMVLEAGDSRQADLAGNFSGKVLTFSASSSSSNVTADVSGSSMTITANRKGSANVTVTATNAAGSASFDIGVTVTAIAAERMVYTDILAAMGRGIMSSVSNTIGGRFSVTASERQVALANRRVDGMAAGMETLISLSGTQETRKYGITDENSAGFDRQPISTRELMRGSSFYYALDDAPQGGMNGGLSFTIWGSGDWNAFEGSPSETSSFDGTLTSGYLGLDVSKSASWIAGVAVGRTMGTSDYDVTVTDGTLEATLNSVYPYVHWTGPGCCIEVWAIGGFGTGEAEVSDGTSDLSMSLGMVGVRAQLVGSATDGLDLDLIGDAGITKLSTADSQSASLSDLEASVQRVRIGLEASRTSDMGSMLFTPFAQVAGRYDGGDGQTGNALEVAGGLRLAGDRAGLEARGRFLAMHTGEEVKEHGVAVVLYVRPMGAGGQGLSVALSPRIGADTDMSGNIWREDPANEVTRTSRSTAPGVKAEIGYGLTTPMLSNILVTPFGQMDMAGDEQRRMRLGARFGSIGDTTSILSFELTGERIDGNGRTADHRIGLLGRMSF